MRKNKNKMFLSKEVYLVNKETNLLNFSKYLTNYTNDVWLINHNLFKSYKIQQDCRIVFPSKSEYNVSTRDKEFFTVYNGDGFQLFIELSKLEILENNVFDTYVCKKTSDKNLSEIFKNAFQ